MLVRTLFSNFDAPPVQEFLRLPEDPGELAVRTAVLYAQEFADRLADARVEIIEGAGHMPQWEQLDRVRPLVLDFLNGAPP